jgi:tRNA-Thr(GGU) m(6)t(6)A37 methyltransferase TsaA
MAYVFETIGTIHSCFKEKFGIPRQSGLVPDARAVLELAPPYSRMENLQGLEGYSHLWVIFILHATAARPDKTTVRPPRLGGNRRVGVFGSRSNFRPNPIGLSVCELERIEVDRGHGRLHLKAVDILDQTPVIDIKPYLPYADAYPAATAGWAYEPPRSRFTVHFSPAAEAVLASLAPAPRQTLRRLIVQVLRLDPRPAYYREQAPKSCFGMRLDQWDVHWEVRTEGIRVNALVPAPNS